MAEFSGNRKHRGFAEERRLKEVSFEGQAGIEQRRKGGKRQAEGILVALVKGPEKA